MYICTLYKPQSSSCLLCTMYYVVYVWVCTVHMCVCLFSLYPASYTQYTHDPSITRPLFSAQMILVLVPCHYTSSHYSIQICSTFTLYTCMYIFYTHTRTGAVPLAEHILCPSPFFHLLLCLLLCTLLTLPRDCHTHLHVSHIVPVQLTDCS